LTLSSADTHGIAKYARTYIPHKKGEKTNKKRWRVRKERKKGEKERMKRKGGKRNRKIREKGGRKKNERKKRKREGGGFWGVEERGY